MTTADEMICRRCNTPLAEHRIFHDAPPDPPPPEGAFVVPTAGLYCPDGSASAVVPGSAERDPSS